LCQNARSWAAITPGLGKFVPLCVLGLQKRGEFSWPRPTSHKAEALQTRCYLGLLEHNPNIAMWSRKPAGMSLLPTSLDSPRM
jgi:hypothetical protein